MQTHKKVTKDKDNINKTLRVGTKIENHWGERQERKQKRTSCPEV